MPSRSPNSSSKRLLILSQYMYPERNSTGELMNSLAAGLVVNGFDVAAFSAQPTYFERGESVPATIVYEGVRIQRMWNTRFGRTRLALRALDGITFALATAFRLIRTSGDITILAVTNPPFLPVIAALRRSFTSGQFVLLVHDIYPEAAVQLKTIRRGGIIYRLWAWMDRFTLSKADRIIALGEDMRGVIARKLPGADAAKVVVISNWADGDRIIPIDKASSANAARFGLIEPFVVQYSGNVGLSQGLDVVLRAARQLRDEDVVFTIIGQGVALASLEDAAASLRLSNVRFLSRAPDSELGDSLAACDAALVPLAEGMEGLSVPSKYYAVLASGRPVLAMMAESAEVARSVAEHDCGVVIRSGDVDGLCRAILRLKNEHALLLRLGQNARATFEQRYTRQRALLEYSSLLASLSGAGRPITSLPDRPGSEQ